MRMTAAFLRPVLAAHSRKRNQHKTNDLYAMVLKHGYGAVGGETAIGVPAATAPLLRERSILMKKNKLINDTAIPQCVIENIARCLLPDILADFERADIQREFAEWQKAQNANAQESVSE